MFLITFYIDFYLLWPLNSLTVPKVSECFEQYQEFVRHVKYLYLDAEKESSTNLWESCNLKVLLESRIVPEILEIELLLLGRAKLLLIELWLLLLWLAGLCLGRKLLSRKLLLGLLLIASWISELVEGISKLGRVEECINAVDEGLEEGSWNKNN